MQRSAFQSACLVLLAVVLSAGSAANASMLTTLPSEPSSTQTSTQDYVQSIDESGHRKALMKSRVCDVTETRSERALSSERSDQIVTATIDFNAIEHVINLTHASVDIQSLEQPFTQQRDTLANLPPPVR